MEHLIDKSKNKRILRELNGIVENIVVNFTAEIPGADDIRYLDVYRIANVLKMHGGRFKATRFCAVRRTLKNPSCGTALFRRKNAICTGSKNIFVALYGINRNFQDIRDHIKTLRWIRTLKDSFYQANMVTKFLLPTRVDLRATHGNIMKNQDKSLVVSYNPESFTALIIKQEKCTVLVFRSGSMTVTGTRTLDRAYQMIRTVLPYFIPERN